MIKAALLALLMLTGCGERARPLDERTAPDLVRAVTSAPSQAVSVRIGEAGPSFAACQATGTPRNSAGEPLTVRGGPFDSAPVTGSIPTDARFFVCTRSIDQRWLGIVFDETGTLSPACGVYTPAPRRADYSGPCRQGWIVSATVRLAAD